MNVRKNGMIVAALALLIASSAQAALVGHWALEQGSGLTAFDTSGAGNDGAFNPNSAATGPQWISSVEGLAPPLLGTTAAVRLDGSNQIDVTGFKGVTGTTARTISAWIRTSNADEDMAIVSWGSNVASQKWNFRTQDDNGTAGAIRAEVNGGFIVGSTNVVDGEWHHVAITWENDGTPNIQDAKLYVDGLLEGVSASLSRSINTASDDDVIFGNDQSNREWIGDLDELQIYDEALSALQIRGLAGIVPEPTTAILGLMGLAGMGLRRRRQNA